MNKAYIDPNKCDRSAMCPARRSCPEKSITQEKLGFFKRGVPVVDSEKCVSCGECIKMCPHGAITMQGPSVGQKTKIKKKKK
ncbi:MAG: 4Fe-4S ferredoxin [Desulfosporosinus sp. BRH_c37]|nr:MAG: 4Fe-4S ferredoxin [Desulfosporosinus sp. BRH_c37]